MDNIERGKALLAIKNLVVENFTAENWRELGILTQSSDLVRTHPRLLRSLSWGDDDYAANVIEVLESIFNKDSSNADIALTYCGEHFDDHSTTSGEAPGAIVKLLRKKDYRFIKELGAGSCGKTVLIEDDEINELYVCKSYSPTEGLDIREYFQKFIREIKLLYKAFHPNVVRIFHHFLYAQSFRGYILMEYVDGSDLNIFLAKHPDRIDDMFSQAIDGFRYLEGIGILHRDIRSSNIRVSNEGRLKIIDFGFGKEILKDEDTDKSVTLNWSCDKPDDFEDKLYTFQTEVYFVGKLFEKIIASNRIQNFTFTSLLNRMSMQDPANRILSFDAVFGEIQGRRFGEMQFTDAEIEVYQRFSSALARSIAQIKLGAVHTDDPDLVQSQLLNVYRSCSLENFVPDTASLIRCFLSPPFQYRKGSFPVNVLREFSLFFTEMSNERRMVILTNLRTKLQSLPHEQPPIPFEGDDIPF
jgi:serine/threonine protein kinase